MTAKEFVLPHHKFELFQEECNSFKYKINNIRTIKCIILLKSLKMTLEHFKNSYSGVVWKNQHQARIPDF